MTSTERKRKRSSRHQPVGRWITPLRRLAIYLRDDFRCQHCFAELQGRGDGTTLDHLTPRSDRRSTNDASNLVTCCKRCNDSRGNRRLVEWYELSPGWVPFPRFNSHEKAEAVRAKARRPLGPYLALAREIIGSRRKEATRCL